jgi:hypothetical protein
VEVHGLQARPDLNAKHARAVAYVPERERYHVVIMGTDEEVYLRRANLTKSAAAAPAMAFSYSLLPRDTVRAANGGDALSQAALGFLHYVSAKRLDLLGAPADDATVAARWAEALRFSQMAAEQGVAESQALSGDIYATCGRSVPQNWTTAAKWWRKAAEAGVRDAKWCIGLCYYYGRGVDRDVEQAKVWFRKAAAQGHPSVDEGHSEAVEALRTVDPVLQDVQEALARFTNAGSAPLRHEAAHEFAGIVNEGFLQHRLQSVNDPRCRRPPLPRRISPCVTASGWISCWLLASLTKTSSSPNASTPTP